MPPDLNDTVARATPGDRRPSAPIEGPGGWGFSPSHAHATRLIFAAAAVAARRRHRRRQPPPQPPPPSSPPPLAPRLQRGKRRGEGGREGKEYLSRRRIRRFTPHAFTPRTFLIWTDQLSVVRRALLGIPLRWYAALPACTARAARCLRLLLYVLLWLRLLRCLLLASTATH